MSGVDRRIVAFLQDEANRATLPAGLAGRVLERAKTQRVVTAMIAGIAVVAIGVSGVVATDFLRSPSRVGPARPTDVPPVEVTRVPVVSAERVAATDDAVFVNGGNELYVLDPETHAVERAVLELPDESGGFAVGQGGIWIAGWRGDMSPGSDTPPSGAVSRLDLDELRRGVGDVAFEDMGRIIWQSGRHSAPEAVDTGFGSAWVTERLGDRLLRFSPEGKLLATIPVGDRPRDLAVGEGAVWVVHSGSDPETDEKGDASLLKIDPASGPTSVAVAAGTCPHSVTTGASAVWVLDFCEQLVRKFDPDTMRSLGVAELPFAAFDLVVGEGYLWTVHPEEGVVLRTDLAELDQIGAPIPLRVSEPWPFAIDHAAGSVWVSGDGLFRLDVR